MLDDQLSKNFLNFSFKYVVSLSQIHAIKFVVKKH